MPTVSKMSEAVELTEQQMDMSKEYSTLPIASDGYPEVLYNRLKVLRLKLGVVFHFTHLKKMAQWLVHWITGY